MSIISMDLSPQVLLILNVIIIVTALTIWLTFKFRKIIQKKENKKN